jgi:nucleoid DNA-binding protein
MTRSELVDRLHSRTRTLIHDNAKAACDLILEAVAPSLVADCYFEILGLGSFGLNYPKPGIGPNPMSSRAVQVRDGTLVKNYFVLS